MKWPPWNRPGKYVKQMRIVCCCRTSCPPSFVRHVTGSRYRGLAPCNMQSINTNEETTRMGWGIWLISSPPLGTISTEITNGVGRLYSCGRARPSSRIEVSPKKGYHQQHHQRHKKSQTRRSVCPIDNICLWICHGIDEWSPFSDVYF